MHFNDALGAYDMKDIKVVVKREVKVGLNGTDESTFKTIFFDGIPYQWWNPMHWFAEKRWISPLKLKR